MRLESSYEKVFSQSTDLKVWPQIAFVLKKTDIFLESVRPSGKGNTENFLKSRRQILGFLALSKILGTFDFSTNDLVNYDTSMFNQEELQLVWETVKKNNFTDK